MKVTKKSRGVICTVAKCLDCAFVETEGAPRQVWKAARAHVAETGHVVWSAKSVDFVFRREGSQ